MGIFFYCTDIIFGFIYNVVHYSHSLVSTHMNRTTFNSFLYYKNDRDFKSLNQCVLQFLLKVTTVKMINYNFSVFI
jgi:hypothetical protein